MKRYIKLIVFFILVISIIGLLFYFLLRQDNSYVTYIRVQVNPSFIIGINEKKQVVFYNSLNEDGNKYNLAMFQGKKLDDAMDVFIAKFGKAKEDKKEINITVMTKNELLSNEIIQIIKESIDEFDSNYQVVFHEPSYDDLIKYSSEVVYNLKKSLDENKLKEIGRKIYNETYNDMERKIKLLNLEKLMDDEKIALLKEKQQEGYFNQFDLFSVSLDNVKLLEGSNYKTILAFQEDNTYTYNIVLALEIEYSKEEKEKMIMEDYIYQFKLEKDEEIIEDLQTYFYNI